MKELPQCASDRRVWNRDDRVSVCPVHASNAFLCDIIQSVVPSRCKTENEVTGDFDDIKAVIGDVAEMRW
jgi:hypothetical protein